MSDEGVYTCPVCEKPFDRRDGLFDFAVSAHEKEHRPQNNNAANMIRYDDASLMWVCKLCGAPLHPGEYTARQMVIGHCRVMHDSVTGGSSSAPVTARGGRGSGSGSRTVGEIVSDVAEDVGEAIVEGLGKALGGIAKLFD